MRPAPTSPRRSARGVGAGAPAARRIASRPGFALLLVGFLGGCAPHRVAMPELTLETTAMRYEAALAMREARGAGADAEVVLWAELENAGRLPGAEGRLLLAAPDGFRLRVGSLFGTALDLAARGDSLCAYVPARRMGLRIDAARESLGLRAPGALAYRALSATWRPPAEAWQHALRRDSLLELSWIERGDTLRLVVGAVGLPQSASIRRDRAAEEVRALYRAWDRGNGMAWPTLIEIGDAPGTTRLICKVGRVVFAPPDPQRLAIAIPPDARRLTLAELRRSLRRLGELE